MNHGGCLYLVLFYIGFLYLFSLRLDTNLERAYHGNMLACLVCAKDGLNAHGGRASAAFNGAVSLLPLLALPRENLGVFFSFLREAL